MDRFEEILNTLEHENKEVQQNYLLKFTKNWHWFVLLCVVGVAAGYVLFSFTPPSYLVQSRLLIPSEDNVQNTLLTFENQITPRNQKIENQIGTLQSFTLYKKALENLNWKTSYYTDEGQYRKELYENPPFEITVANGAKNTEGLEIEIIAINDHEFNIKAEGKISINGEDEKIEFQEKGNFNTVFKNRYFDFILSKKNCTKGKKYYMVFNNINSMTRNYLKNIKILLEEEESELVNVQVISQTPQKEADFIKSFLVILITFSFYLMYIIKKLTSSQ